MYDKYIAVQIFLPKHNTFTVKCVTYEEVGRGVEVCHGAGERQEAGGAIYSQPQVCSVPHRLQHRPRSH